MLISNLRLNQQTESSNGGLRGVGLVSFSCRCQDLAAEPSWHNAVKCCCKPICDHHGGDASRKNGSGCGFWFVTTVPLLQRDFPGSWQPPLARARLSHRDRDWPLSWPSLWRRQMIWIEDNYLWGVDQQSRSWTSAHEASLSSSGSGCHQGLYCR